METCLFCFALRAKAKTGLAIFTVLFIVTDQSPKFPPALRRVLGVKSLA